jgi:hypothetical protein
VFASVILISLMGCGGNTASSSKASLTSGSPQYLSEPFTPQQQLVAQGARLAVSYGCTACHLAKGKQNVGPAFASFADHYVTLKDGHRVLVDERFLRGALLDPRRYLIKGYDPAPMLGAIGHLHLDDKRGQVAALAAFIEEIGPEPETG